MPPTTDELKRTLTDLGASALEESGAPGLALSLFTPEGVLFERGFGLRDREAGLPVTPDTIFGVASVTKSFTALTTLLLAERGVVSLADRADSYFGFGSFWEDGRAATIANLLSHAGGIPPTPTMTWLRYSSQENDTVMGERAIAEAKLTLVDGATGMPSLEKPEVSLALLEAAAGGLGTEEARERLAELAPKVATFEGLAAWIGANAEPLAAPGELYSYSNDSYCLVGGMLERATGEKFDALVEQEILRPLGMNRTTFNASVVTADADHSTLYTRGEDKEVLRSPLWQSTGRMLAGGMLKSTLRDLRVYVTRLLTDMPRQRALSEARISSAPDESYGLGLVTQPDYRGLRVIRHGGSLKGVSSAIGFVPALNVGAVVLCNLDGVNSQQLLLDALSAYAGLEPGVGAYEPDGADPSVGVSELLGEYLSGEPYGRLRLYQNEAGELSAAVGWPKVDVSALLVAPDEVALTYPDGRQVPVRFLREENGAVWGAQSGRVLRRL